MVEAHQRRERAPRNEKTMNQLSKHTNLGLNILMILSCIAVLLPIWLIIIASFTEENTLKSFGYAFWPREFSTKAYTYLFSSNSIIGTAYKNTVLSTVLGTIASMISVGLYAYPLSRKEFRFRKFFAFFSFFTMLFNGGLVSYFFVARNVLNLTNSLWALFLPLSFSAFWVLVMRTFYTSAVPDAVIESARIDGASEWRTLLQIVLPLSLPGLATVALFSAVGVWNNFFQCMLLTNEAKYFNLQYTIYTTLNNIRFLKDMASSVGGNFNISVAELPSETFRMGMAVLTVGPIILAYPFFQRYFIRGLTIGAVKG
ncbi:MAG: carbohydrate ABC transporter permease [Clostridia bacterium]|nr:carbohydrate ABC transporter permease [Clostridia bacterium]